MVGRVEMLKMRSDLPPGKARLLDLSALLYKDTQPHYSLKNDPKPALTVRQSDILLDGLLDKKLLAESYEALHFAQPFQGQSPIRNTDRAVGTLLSAAISRQWRGAGLPDACLQWTFNGSAGQSFGAFGAKGLQFLLEGEANDYFGKGLSGARLIVRPSRQATFVAADNILIGNVALMGATAGEVFLNGRAGERFAVRNSGATAVVEGIGDHGCEYMTGGLVIILGSVGRNFAAGMTGGLAYMYDPLDQLTEQYNAGEVDIERPGENELHQVELLIQRHLAYTASAKATALLEDWAEQQAFFKKIIPREYKAALQKKNGKPASTEHRQNQGSELALLAYSSV